MTARERGYLLLCADLGTQVRPLTLAQLKQLRQSVQAAQPPSEPDRDLTAADVRALGFSQARAEQIEALLAREAELDAYLGAAALHEIGALTVCSRTYPASLRAKLGADAPAVLFYRGEPALLQKTCVSLVGARRLGQGGAAFARRVGELAAQEGYVLVSGNADGADTLAQEACLKNGGSVISVLADSPADHFPLPNMLYLCEEGWHLPFTAARALRRNRIIHALGQKSFVAQTGNGVGGTWRGTADALRRGMTVYVHADGSDGAASLAALGAELIPLARLTELSTLRAAQTSFFEK